MNLKRNAVYPFIQRCRLHYARGPTIHSRPGPPNSYHPLQMVRNRLPRPVHDGTSTFDMKPVYHFSPVASSSFAPIGYCLIRHVFFAMANEAWRKRQRKIGGVDDARSVQHRHIPSNSKKSVRRGEMVETTAANPQTGPEHPIEERWRWRNLLAWDRLALEGILLIAVFSAPNGSGGENPLYDCAITH
jgi:hypothetical protein